MKKRYIREMARGAIRALDAGASPEKVMGVLSEVCGKGCYCTMDRETCVISQVSKRALKMARRKEE